MVIGKFTVSNIADAPPHNPTIAKKVTLFALYDDNLDEDKRFATSTPSGHVEMVITNPNALEQFKPLETPIYCVFMGPEEYQDFCNLMKNG